MFRKIAAATFIFALLAVASPTPSKTHANSADGIPITIIYNLLIAEQMSPIGSVYNGVSFSVYAPGQVNYSDEPEPISSAVPLNPNCTVEVVDQHPSFEGSNAQNWVHYSYTCGDTDEGDFTVWGDGATRGVSDPRAKVYW